MSEEPAPLKDPFAIGDDEREHRARRTPLPRVLSDLPDPFAHRPIVAEATPVPVAAPRPSRRPALSDEPLRRPAAVPAPAPAPAAVHPNAQATVLMPGARAPSDQATVAMPGFSGIHGAGGADQATVAMPGFARAPAQGAPGFPDLTGRELTMPATPAAGTPPMPLGAEPTLLSGRELTMPATPAAGTPPMPLGAEPTLLTGREMTMPATPAGGITPVTTDQGRAALNTPRTIAGFQGMPARQARATPTPGRPGTAARHETATSDDAWHYQGRLGAFTGQQWGDWEIGGILGEGGMGTVYRAKQKSLNRRVALKVLSPNLAADLKLLQRFQLEARTASLLASPNVVQVFAAGEWEDNHFFVMEYIEGRDLYDVMKARTADGKPFTPDEAADIVVQAARGLAEAGRIGVVHRDIKPPNLMVTVDGLVKVADFGIVKVMGESALTMTGQAVGTPSYVSPEQGRGESNIDQRSDLYSLGVVFYELLTGKKPFEGSTPNAIIYQHCFGEPRLPRELNPLIDEKYQAVVLKCLQKKAENRYQNAGELIRDLEDIRAGRMLASALASYRQGTGADEAKRENMSWSQRHLLVLVSAIGLGVIGAGFGLWWLIEISNDNFQRREAQRQRAGELFNSLKDLDSPRTIPAGAKVSLAEYADLPDADQRRVVLWRNKLKSVDALTSSLSQLKGGSVPLALRRKAPGELQSYQLLVGIADPDAAEWRDKLERMAELERDLRISLRSIDQQAELTQSLVDSVRTPLEQLGVISGSDDPLFMRIDARLQAFAARHQRLRANLAVLDQDTVITDADRRRLKSELEELGRMIGQDHPDVLAWGLQLTTNADRALQLRARLRRLDQFELPPVALQLELEKDFAALKELVDDKDPELRGWKAKLAATAAEIEVLRKRLARLDQPVLLPISEVDPMGRLLESLRTLVGDGDEQLLGWQKQLRAAVARHGDLRSSLARLERADALTLDEQRLLAGAREQLNDVGGLTPEQDAACQRRLNDERIHTRARVERLQAYDHVASVATLRGDLGTFTLQAGEGHPDVQRWTAKQERIDAQRARLAAFTAAAPLPDDAEAGLAALALEVGDQDAEVRAWRDKMRRVAGLHATLAPLEGAQPLPAGVEQTLLDLAQEVGEHDAHVRRGQAKVARVTQLMEALARAFAAYGHSPAAHARLHADFAEALALVSASDARLAAWRPRLAHLDGPAQPAWASAMGRDDFGLWADLALAQGVVQRFRFVPAGICSMGSPEGEAGREPDEIAVRVTISKALWLADTECTQAAWAQVTGRDPSRHRSPDQPVERVSWLDAQDFLARVRQAAGIAARLPSEAEWEYAARAGGAGTFASARPEASGLASVAWFAANAGGVTKAVKLRFPNPIGLYDLHGNVWEWCADRYASYATVPVSDPLGRDGPTCVVRGGSWGDPAATCRVANRAALRPEVRSAYVGLRLAVDVDASSPVAAPPAPAETPTQAVAAEVPTAASVISAPAPPVEVPAAEPVTEVLVPAPAPVAVPAVDAAAPAPATPPAAADTQP